MNSWPRRVLFIIMLLLSTSLLSLAVPGDILFEDEFASPSTNWRFDRNNWLIRDGVLAHDDFAIGTAYYTGGQDWTDYEWETKFQITKYGNENSAMFLFFRSKEAWSGYGLAITRTSMLLSRYDGAWNERVILGQTSLNTKPNTWFNLKIQVQANQIKVFVNDKLRLDVFDPDNKYPHGSFSYYTDYLTAEVDLVKVTEQETLEVKTSNRKIATSILDEEETNWPGYKVQGSSEVMGAKHIMLYYTHHNWNEYDLLPYVAYGERKNPIDDLYVEYKDWFFDTFLLLYNQFGDTRTSPTDITKWQLWLDLLFGADKHLDSLNRAVDLARKQGVKGDNYKAKVIVMIPYPSPEQPNFGDVDGDGINENFSKENKNATDDRVKAANWFIEQTLANFSSKRFANLELIGFYWFEEQIDGADGSVIKATANRIHEEKLMLYWIPMFDATGASSPKAYGFDAVMMQPNYFWPKNLSTERLARTAAMARKYNLGVEIEFDANANNEFYRKRFYEYLDMGVHTGYMKNALLSYYEGGGDVLKFFRSKDPEIHKMYQALYEFVKGTYKPREILKYNN